MPTQTSDGDSGHTTRVLAAAQAGDRDARETLWDLVYDRMKAMAARYRLRPEDVLHRTTDVVHTAFELLQAQRCDMRDSRHFFAVAALAMRRVVTSWARNIASASAAKASPDDALAQAPAADAAELLDLDAALAALEHKKPRCARVVEMHWFAGLEHTAIAQALGVSERTVAGDWAFARAWLRRRMGATGAEADAVASEP